MSTIFKATALADDIECFFDAAVKGGMHVAKEEPAPLRIGSQQTPISYGLSEGYSHQDIAHFYIARQLGNDWRLRIIENLNKDFLSKVEEALDLSGEMPPSRLNTQGSNLLMFLFEIPLLTPIVTIYGTECALTVHTAF